MEATIYASLYTTTASGKLFFMLSSSPSISPPSPFSHVYLILNFPSFSSLSYYTTPISFLCRAKTYLYYVYTTTYMEPNTIASRPIVEQHELHQRFEDARKRTPRFLFRVYDDASGGGRDVFPDLNSKLCIKPHAFSDGFKGKRP